MDGVIEKKVVLEAARAIGQGLRMARAYSNKKQSAVAAEYGWKTGQSLSMYENGHRTPTMDTLTKLAGIYKVPVDQILRLGSVDFSAGERI